DGNNAGSRKLPRQFWRGLEIPNIIDVAGRRRAGMIADFHGAGWAAGPSPFWRRTATESHIRNTRSAIAEWTFGQRGRSKPVTGAALGAWRVAWVARPSAKKWRWLSAGVDNRGRCSQPTAGPPGTPCVRAHSRSAVI